MGQDHVPTIENLRGELFVLGSVFFAIFPLKKTCGRFFSINKKIKVQGVGRGSKGCLSWQDLRNYDKQVSFATKTRKKDSVKKWYEMIYVVASLGGTMLTLHHYMLCLQSTLTKLWRISSDFSTTITSCSVVKTLVAIHSECLPKNTVACKIGNWRVSVSLLDGFMAALTVLEGLR